MKRNAFVMQLKPGFEAEYQRRHDKIWPELHQELQAAGVSDYSIFLHPGTLQLCAFQKLGEKNTKTVKVFEDTIRQRLEPFTDVPIGFTSVTEKQRVLKVIETANKVYENRAKKIPTSKLNDVMLPIIENYPPPSLKGKYVKIKYITQIKGVSPMFAFFCNLPQYIKEPYMRFLENKLRENFDFTGVPVQIFFRQK